MLIYMFKRSLLLVLLFSLHGAIIGQITDYKATYYVDGNEEKDQYRSHISLESLAPGASTVYATNGVHLVLTRMRLNKTSGSMTDPDRRETGRNSVLLADAGSTVTVEYCEVNAHTQNSDGISACGDGTKIKVVEGTVNVSRAGSAGMNAAGKGNIIVDKTTINTFANQNPSFYVCKDGTMEVHEAKGENVGQASPLFYTSTGAIRADKCRMSSGKWTIGSLDEGLLELTENEVTAGGVCGFLVYGADEKERQFRSSGVLVLNKNKITVTEGPLIFVTNAGADITLSGNKITCRNDEIISIKADEWGPKGFNQGDAIINVENQTLNGNIYVDSISTLQLDLKKNAKLNGSITGGPSERRDVKVWMRKGSTWTVKGDVYLTFIMFDQPLEKGLKQIKGKHVIYYDPEVWTDLGGKEYKTGGGVLRPISK